MNDFLKIYMSYTEHQESPEPFHFWVGVFLIAATLGRKVYLPYGPYKIYPNLYICLVAPSGKCRKGGALDMGVPLLEEVPELVVLRDRLTGAYLPMRLAKQGQVVIIADELATLLGSKNRPEEDLVSILTRAYACPEKMEYFTKTAGQYRAERVCINLLAASTPDWLLLGHGGGEIAGGFVARWIFVVQEHTPRIFPFPWAEEELKIKLIGMLSKIAQLEGHLTITKEADKHFRKWYSTKKTAEKDTRLASYYSRKHTLVLKVAMCSAVARDASTTIEKTDVERAITWLKVIEKWMPTAFQKISAGERGRVVDNVIDTIIRTGKISYPQLLRQMLYWGISGRDLQDILGELSKAGLVVYDKGMWSLRDEVKVEES